MATRREKAKKRLDAIKAIGGDVDPEDLAARAFGDDVERAYASGDALHDVAASIVSAEPRDQTGARADWLIVQLLGEAEHVATAIGRTDLSRVLIALSRAVERQDLSILKRPPGTMLSIANGYLGDDPFAASRPDLIRLMVRSFAALQAKVKSDQIGETFAAALAKRHGVLVHLLDRFGARTTFGEPQPDHVAKITAECAKITGAADAASARKGHKVDPDSIDLARAFLRGWGVAAAKAKDWTSFLSKEAKRGADRL